MKNVLFSLMLFVFLLSGCGDSNPSTSVQSVPSVITTSSPTPSPIATPKQTAAPTTTPKITATPIETAAPAEAQEINVSASKPEQAVKPKAEKKAGNIVYIGKTGKKYHNADCPSLKGKGIEITYEEAIEQGREPCKICQPN